MTDINTTLVDLATRFYNEAESPEPQTYTQLFAALVNHDVEAVKRLLRDADLGTTEMTDKCLFLIDTTDRNEIVTRNTLQEAAEAMALTIEELEWAIETTGRCDTEHFVALPVEPEMPDGK